jgi:hypothetical protein
MGGPPTVETVNYIQPLDLGGSLRKNNYINIK